MALLIKRSGPSVKQRRFPQALASRSLSGTAGATHGRHQHRGDKLSELPAPFRIRTERGDQNTTTIAVEGELDLSTAPDLSRVLGEALAAGRTIRLDLSAVEFMDSTGLAAIIQPLRHLADGSRPVRVLGELSRQPRKLLELAGVLGSLLPIEEREAGAEPAEGPGR